ncbi:MAG: hypothetical protein KAS04_00085, partial [Candidatus Aenigmarchaeota archaeon]|nr:hypothetical protein [Candidatus Aenigmarchaeota archaeon]
QMGEDDELREKDQIKEFYFPLKTSDVSLAVGLRGSSKCASPDSVFLTEHGLIKLKNLSPRKTKEDEFVPLKIKVLSKDGEVETSHFYDGGVKDTLKVRTKRGYELEGTYVHPILVLCKDLKFKYKQLSELEIGDFVCISRGQEYWSKKPFDLSGFSHSVAPRNKDCVLPVNMTKDLARLMGYLVADGYTAGKKTFSFTNSVQELVDDYMNSCVSSFGLIPSVSGKSNSPNCHSYTTCNDKASSFLEYCGVKKVLSKDKEIPRAILQSPREFVVEYLKAYFECDCHLHNVGIEVSTASEQMSIQLQTVLLNFGIVSYRRMKMACATNGTKIKRPYYFIHIYGIHAEKFVNEIGFISKERKKNCQKFMNKNRNTNIDIVPFARERLSVLHNKHKGGPNGCGNTGIKTFGRRGWDYIGHVSYGNTKDITIDGLKELSQYANDEDFSEISKYGFFFDYVVSKEKSKSQVYDIAVPKHHNFIANGFVNHNTFFARADGSRAFKSGFACLYLTDIKGEMRTNNEPLQSKFHHLLNEHEKPEAIPTVTLMPVFMEKLY